jgi:hypothetical protein
MGYVPLFDSLTKGTLHGRWPDIGLWPVVLSMADRHGILDVTPEYIAGVTGLALDEVEECMARFCAPDPRSRTMTAEDEGRRLVLLDDRRSWGWKVVNHAHYREKARMLAKNSEATASGMDAERKRKSREKKACPPMSTGIRLSDGDGDGDGDKNLRSSSESTSSTSSSDKPNGSDDLNKSGRNKKALKSALAAVNNGMPT